MRVLFAVTQKCGKFVVTGENTMEKVYYIITNADGTAQRTKSYDKARKFFLNGFHVVEVKEVNVYTETSHIAIFVSTQMQ